MNTNSAAARDFLVEDHKNYQHTRRPQSGCQACIAEHEATRTRFESPTRCPASGHIFSGAAERTNGSGAWATGHCPTCARKVGITRPTNRVPWSLVGTHNR